MKLNSIFTTLFISLFLIFTILCPAQKNLVQGNKVVAIKTTNIVESKELKLEIPSPYELSILKEMSLFSAGFGLSLSGMALEKSMKPLTIADIEFLNKTNVGAFDRHTIGNSSKTAQKTSDYLLFSSVAFPMLLMADKTMRKDYVKIGTMATQALVLNTGVTTLVKGAVKRTRPYVYDPNIPLEKKFSKSARLSFFSGHTSTVAVMSFFTAKVFSDYHPDSKLKPVVWTAAIALPATTAYMRYKAGKHFPSDVIIGYGVGAAIGILIPHLHRNKKQKQYQITPMASGDAVGFNLHAVF